MTRAECRAAVIKRACGRCERCGGRASDRYPVWHPHRAHVNERIPRSRGGDPTSLENTELLCASCHFPGGRHAPTKARMEALRTRRTEEWP